ncbi:MAG TPA: alpha/beta hydrolase [Vicinamibacterales bacterium]|jgi:acetyl esterase/lipase
MHSLKHIICVIFVAAACVSEANAQRIAKDQPYGTASERQVLDVYAPPGAKNLPVVFWIHGGGWQTGDKTMVALKPKAFTDAGLVFVSINHRLLPTVDMAAITRDVASALGWVHKNIAAHGGDPNRLLVMGHSSGGQLAALMCTDDRYAKAEGFSLRTIKGCVPVDADTFDIPAIIDVAETRARAHHLPLPTYGHRQKFGDDPAKHRDFSAVTHVARDKGIPPFLILHIAGHPDTTAQARRLANVLEAAGIPVKVVAGRETTHASINDNIGAANDPVTKELFAFVADALRPAAQNPSGPTQWLQPELRALK